MANLSKVRGQNKFLESYLRGTGRTMSAAQASANYGIKRLAARVYELRAAGLNVTTARNKSGSTVYKISARDVTGSRARVFA